MTYTTVDTVTSSDTLTVSRWNNQVKGNLDHLYGRKVRRLINPANATNSAGVFPAVQLVDNGTGTARFAFIIGDDFSSLDSIHLVGIMSSSTGNINVDASSQYGNPDTNQNPNNHSSTGTLTDSATANKFTYVDISSYFASLAAGDVCAFEADSNGSGWSGGPYFYVIGIHLVYTRT